MLKRAAVDLPDLPTSTRRRGERRDVSATSASSATPKTALRESERRYQSVIEALSEGVDDAGSRRARVIAFNRSAERILGLPRGARRRLLPRPLVPLIHEDGSPFLGEEHPTMVSVRTGEPQRGVVMGVESPDGPDSLDLDQQLRADRIRRGEPYAAV